MNMRESPLRPPDEFASIVGRLRSIPPPAVPDGLQAALVSAIPVRAAPPAAAPIVSAPTVFAPIVSAPIVSARTKAQYFLAGATLAATIAAFLFSAQARPDHVARMPNARTDRVVSPAVAPVPTVMSPVRPPAIVRPTAIRPTVRPPTAAPLIDRNPKETDPCNILPPLGDWRW